MKYILMIVAILVLNCLDIYNTLIILSYGGTELNPAMDYLIQKDVMLFGFVKMFVTSMGLFVLYMYKKEYIKYILLFYIVLIIYQIYLLILIDIF